MEDAQFPTASALRQSALMQQYRTHDGTCNNFHRPRWGSTMTPVQRFLHPSYSDGLQTPRRCLDFVRSSPAPRDDCALGWREQLNQVSAYIDGSPLYASSARQSDKLRLFRNGMLQYGRVQQRRPILPPGRRDELCRGGAVSTDCFKSGDARVNEHPGLVAAHILAHLNPHWSDEKIYQETRRIVGAMVQHITYREFLPIVLVAAPMASRVAWKMLSSQQPVRFASRHSCNSIPHTRRNMQQLPPSPLGVDHDPRVRCLDFVRSSPAPRDDCALGWREQLNQVSAYIDGSPLYASSARQSDKLRLFRNGMLQYGRVQQRRPILPPGRRDELCRGGAVSTDCFKSGDARVNEHPGLVAAHILAHLNPHWSDEKIYQETRRIVGAMVQHITYREFLPIVLDVSLHMELTNPSNIWSMGAVDRLLLGMANQPIQRRDEFITHELTNHLFQTPATDFGMDLAAINIQRGRDHGVPPYTSWREPCGLSAISGFEDLFKVMPARAVRKLKVLYRHVDDVDLFTGGMAERPVVGGLVGPTFACIIAQQFSNLRKGDRFWYENGDFDSSLTPAQLQQIRRISFAQVLCRTLDTIDNIQPFAFLSPDHPDNDRVSCQNGLLNNFDLSPWIEIDSESDNDIRKSDRNTEKPRKPTTTKPPTTTEIKHKIASIPHHDNAKTMNATQQLKDVSDYSNVTAKDSNDTLHFTLNIDKEETVNKTVHIDDKLDFKNKSKRLDDTDSRNKPSKQYSDYDYDDDEDTQSVQSVIVSQGPQKRPYHYQSNRPILTVTENTNKYTYLINYVPRPTESYQSNRRRTTRKTYDGNRDRDIVKVTYQTYDDTYRRPNKPYYNRPDYYENYRNNRPNTRTTVRQGIHSSARANDEIERTTTKTKSHKTHKPDSTTENNNMYKLVTFGYVGNYRGDMNDKLSFKTDEIEAKHDTMSKDFTTHDVKTDNIKDETNTLKLSTFYVYDSSTKPYNLQRSTRRNDDLELVQPTNNKIRNVLRYPDPDKILTDQVAPYKDILSKPDTTTNGKVTNNKDIIKENYNNPGVPEINAEERSSLENMPELDKTETKTANKLKVKEKKPSKPAQTPSVAFQVIPSEISPSQWAVYDEDSNLSEELPHRSPPIKTDPYALKEIPRPITLIGFRRRWPGLF
ncbi:putative oxidase/peroxidase [Operophtera brumata]|uniref:Putative oxidase/peroxidase n=1 Tax=Operophtera brumata TaxID=104452 RepID=A0A0L7LN70_OPEBR|nr:putative oxidase/peroxidase [Operophtera brumata]